MNKELFAKRLQEQIDAIDDVLGAFVASLTPMTLFHELKWADTAFEQAARRHVYTYVLREIRNADKGVTEPLDVRAWILKKTVESARDRSKSTSTCTNLIARCETEAWAAAAELAEMCP